MTMDDDPHRVLARNAACHQCRRRKLKCDAIRPTCGNCRKPRQRGPIKYEPPEPCTWDEVRGPSARTLRKREAKQRRAAQEGPLSGHSLDWAMNMNGQPRDPHAARVEDENYVIMDNMGPNGIMPGMQAGPSSGGMDWGGGHQTIPSGQGSASWAAVKTKGFSHNDMPDDPSWGTPGELILSDWPRDLPAPGVINHIVHVFFERVPIVPKMFNRAKFMTSCNLPPSHSSFPLTVLHGILAATAPFISAEALASRAYFPTGTSGSDQLHPELDFSTLSGAAQPSGMMSLNARLVGNGTPLSRFQMWHRRKCVEGLSAQVSFGAGLLESIYSTSLVSYMDYMNGWFVDIWMEAMSGVRLGVALNLCISSQSPNDSLDRNIAYLLQPVSNAAEQSERDRVWWMAYMMEKLVCSGMTWPLGVADDEITVELPVTQAMFEAGGDDVIGVQSLQSPDLYSFQPPQHLDPFPLLVKTMKLFTDTNTFMRRYSKGQHTYVRYMSDPALRQLLNDINAFRMSWPASMRSAIRQTDSGAAGVDPDLFLVIGFTHASVVNLGEPLITHQTWANDAAKMVLSAIRAILSGLYDINATSYDITLLPSQASFLWTLASRCLGRFINASRLAGDNVAADVFEAEYQIFEMALAQHGTRHPIARRHLKRVQFFRTAWVKEGQLSAKVAYDRGQVFDEEFDYKQKQPTTSSGSPSNNLSELNTPVHCSNSGLSPVPSLPAMVSSDGPHVLRMPQTSQASQSSPMSGSSALNGTALSPHAMSVGTMGVPSPVGSGMGVPHTFAPGLQLQHPVSMAPLVNTQHFSSPGGIPPQQQQPQPPPPLQAVPPIQTAHISPIQQQMPPPPPVVQPPVQAAPPPNSNGHRNPNMMAPGGHEATIPDWYQGMGGGFDISSYSFDVDSMLAILQAENPNATFDGTTAFSLSTV